MWLLTFLGGLLAVIYFAVINALEYVADGVAGVLHWPSGGHQSLEQVHALAG